MIAVYYNNFYFLEVHILKEKLKMPYETPDVQISLFSPEDVITTSGDNEIPDNWSGGWL